MAAGRSRFREDTGSVFESECDVEERENGEEDEEEEEEEDGEGWTLPLFLLLLSFMVMVGGGFSLLRAKWELSKYPNDGVIGV